MAAVSTRSVGNRLSAPNLVAIGIMVAVAGWLVWNLVDAPSQFGRVVVIGLTNGAIYALIALGYTLVYGIIELINFAHGDLFMLGSVFSVFMLYEWIGVGAAGSAGTWLILVGVFVATMVFCGTINTAIERIAYRPLRNAPKLAALITAIGMSFILQGVGLLWNGPSQRGIRRVLPGGNAFEIAGVGVSWVSVLVVAATVPLLLLLRWVIASTKPGKAMRAVAQDADAARLMGIDVDRTIAFTFLVGGVLAGAAGLMYAQFTTTVRYDQGFQLGLIAFTAAVLGGIGNVTGAVLGAVLIGLIQALNEGLPHAFGAEWSQSLVFSILILILVFRPEGLLGEVGQEKV